jgi:hypothetical protein
MKKYALLAALLSATGPSAHGAHPAEGIVEQTNSVPSSVFGGTDRRITSESFVAHELRRAEQVVRATIQNDDEAIRALLRRLEQAVRAGHEAAYSEVLLPSADRARVTAFVDSELRPGATNVVLQERDRTQLPGTLPGNGYRLTVDAFIEHGNRARVATWQLDIRKVTDREWRVQDQSRISQVDNLFRLALDSTRQFAARDFTIKAEDLELRLVEGSVFSVNADGQETGLVLLGRGEMRFRPTPETERGQVAIFAGTDTLESEFDAAYVRTGYVDLHADRSRLVLQASDPREVRRAEQIFREESSKTFVLDLGDLSTDAWSMLPSYGDFLAEIRSRRFDTLTYIRSASEAEDISVFHRRGGRNISLYTSQEKLASRGRFFDEDEAAAYDVLDYNVETAFSPDRLWFDGRTQLRLRIRTSYAAQLNLKLADSLNVHAVYSDRFGYLFHLRAKGQNLVLVNLPSGLLRDAEMTLTIAYRGRLQPQSPEREALMPGQTGDRRPPLGESIPVRLDPTYLYSGRSYWYAQAPASDYATATMKISLPPPFSCVASGEMSSESPLTTRGADGETRREYEFKAERPVRYLAFVAGRFTRAGGTNVTFDGSRLFGQPVGNGVEPVSTRTRPSARSDSLDLTVMASPFLVMRGRQLIDRAADIARFYQSIVGDSPYPTFTLTVIESVLPGGHSPASFATLNQPMSNPPLTWQNDPADFTGYPEFFLAHEMAHQWWGQAVGWRNYHEQWLSEGIAQYFAALYAQHYRGEQVFTSMMRRMRSSAIAQSPEGPVYLGYRLGHIDDNSRIFRALVYNKGAGVLHMLRGLIGDEAFFAGLRRFYLGSRYQKGSTEDLRFAMEWESGRSLERFMERWIYGAALPDVTFSYRVESGREGQELVLRFDQAGEIFDVPISVTLEYADRRSTNVSVPLTERTVETRVPLDGVLRSVNIDDAGTIAEIRRAP